MNKIVGAVSSIVLAFYADAISLDEYKKHCTEIETSEGVFTMRVHCPHL